MKNNKRKLIIITTIVAVLGLVISLILIVKERSFNPTTTIVNATTKITDLGKGRYQAELSITPSYYFRNDVWKEITNKIGKTQDKEYPLGVEELFEFKFKDTLSTNAPPFFFKYQESFFKWTPLNTNQSKAEVNDNYTIYKDAWNGADLKLTVAGHYLKEDILLKDNHPREFAFRIDESSNFNPKFLSFGSFTLQEPILIKVDESEQKQLNWEVNQVDGKYILKTTLPDGNWSGWILDPTTIIQPDATDGVDTEIAGAYAVTYNYGVDTFMTIGEAEGGGKPRRGLIKFDLSSLPGNITVNTATLSMYMGYERSTTDYDIRAHRLLVQFYEGTKNGTVPDPGEDASVWSYRNYNGSVAWSGGAGGGSGSDYAATETDTTTITGTGWFDWDLTTDIELFSSGSATNYGWWLYNTSESTNNTGKRFNSSDNATASSRPKLTIDYTVNEGAVAIWHMNEGGGDYIGTTVYDSTTKANNLTMTNAIWDYQPGQAAGNKSVKFDGTGDRLSRSYDSDFDFADQGFSVSGWFKHGNTLPGTQHTILARYSTTGYKIYMDSSGNICFFIDDGSNQDTGCTANTSYADTKWHHFEVVKDGTSNIYVYIDSQLSNQTAVTANSNLNSASATLYLGMDSDGSSYGWVGWLDEFYIYNYARSADEIKSDYAGQYSTRFGSSVTDSLQQGLIGWWKLDESSGNATDSSGNGNTGTWNGTGVNHYTSGKFGNGGGFNGSDDYIQTTSSDLKTANNFTLSTWFKTTSTACCSMLLWEGEVTGNGYGNQAEMNLAIGNGETSTSNVLNFFLANGIYTSDPNSLNCQASFSTTNTWTHVAVVVSNLSTSPSCQLYINGELQVTDTGSSSTVIRTAWDTNLRIGRTGTSSRYLSGTMDETRIYNRTLSPAEVTQLYNWAPGPLGYWQFDENSEVSTIKDSSGYANFLNASGSFWAGSWQPGKLGYSLLFGSSEMSLFCYDSDCGGTTKLDIGSRSWSIGAWIKTTNASNQIIVGKGTASGQYAYSLETGRTSSDGKPDFYLWNTSNTAYLQADGTTAVDDGNWHHLEGTYDGTTIKLYIDGVLNASSTTTSGTQVTDSTSIFEVGAVNESTKNFEGLIDDVKVYDYARTPGQVIEDMNAGHPAPGSPVGSPYVWYRFDTGHDSTAYNSGNGGSSLNGSITSGTWNNSGKIGKALTFTASSSVTTTIVDPGYTNSISLWVYPTTSAASKTIVTASTAKLTTDSSSRPVYGGCTGTALSLSTWAHILAVSNGSGSCAIYQNGQLTSSGTTGVTLATSLNVGSSSYVGSIDEFKLYTTALTSDQAKQEYNFGKSQVLGAVSTDASGNASWGDDRSYCPPGDNTASCAPIAEWKMDENTGTNAYDTSGSGYTGTLANGPTWVAGKKGGAVKLDGSDDNIGMGDILKFTNSQAATISVWFNPLSFANSNQWLVARMNTAGTRSDYNLILIDNTTVSYSYDDASIAEDAFFNWTVSTISTNTWHNFTVILNTNTTVDGYFDGQFLGTKSSAPHGDYTSTNFYIGEGTSADNPGTAPNGTFFDFNGLIDNVKVYNYALSTAQIAWDYNQGAPLVHYKADECTGSTLNNAAPSASGADSGNDATIYPQSNDNNATGTCGSGTATEMWNDGTTGKYNASLGFDGNDDYAVSGAAALIAASAVTYSNVSWGAWVKTGATPNGDVILQRGNPASATEQEFRLTTDASGNPQCGVCTGATCSWNSVTGTSALTTGVWTHLICTYDGSNIKLYVNSNLNNSASHSTAITSRSTGVESLARDPQSPTGTYINSLIDEAKIWSYALTSQQIKTDFNAGKAVKF